MKYLNTVYAAMVLCVVAGSAQATTFIPESDDAPACKRTQLNDRSCGRWYKMDLVENNPRDRYNRPGVSLRPKRWYIANKPAPKPAEPQVIILDGVEFDTARSTIRSSSIPVLQSNIAKLQSQGNIEIEIVGHTDSQGGDAYNQTLSENRAQAVLNYFSENGISSTRMRSRGAGETQPVDTNETADGRQRNRRIEIHITRK